MVTEIESLETQVEAALHDIKGTIGNLSDLRYGKFSRIEGVTGDVAQEVAAGLDRLEGLCEHVSRNT